MGSLAYITNCRRLQKQYREEEVPESRHTGSASAASQTTPPRTSYPKNVIPVPTNNNDSADSDAKVNDESDSGYRTSQSSNVSSRRFGTSKISFLRSRAVAFSSQLATDVHVITGRIFRAHLAFNRVWYVLIIIMHSTTVLKMYTYNLVDFKN